MDLRVARIGEVGALAVRPPDGRAIAPHRVGRQEEDVAVPAGRQDDGVGDVGFDLAGDHVARDDAPRFAVLDDELHHLVPAVALDRPGRDLALKRLIGADEQLLARLAAGVEGAGDLHAAEGAVVQVSAVLPGEGDPLCHALVDDVGADLGQAVDVRLPGAEVAALDRVVEEPVSRIVVVLVVLRRVDAALSGDRVGAARGVLVEERLDVVPHLAQ